MKKLVNLALIMAVVILPNLVYAQVGINTNGSAPNASAMLDVKSTTSGMLTPRLTQSQIEAIENPANGLIIFCTTDDKFYAYIAADIKWKEVAFSTGEIIPQATFSIGSGGTCSSTSVNGSYIAGQILTGSDYVTIEADVTYVGSYSITTNTLNGYSFSANDVFTTTGTQGIQLAGSGTPVTAQTDNFTATAAPGGGTCTFDVIVQPWICGVPIIDSRNTISYNTTLIGSQCWLAENMNIGTMIANTSNQTDNSEIQKYCYNNTIGNCTAYGGLYQWGEAMQYSTDTAAQGICPSGWHIPTDYEWKVLEGNVDGTYGVGHAVWEGTSWRGSNAGQKLKSTTIWCNSGWGTDDYNFTALPAGRRYINQPNYNFEYFCYGTFFWTSKQSPTSDYWFRQLQYDNTWIYRNVSMATQGFSVRCVKN